MAGKETPMRCPLEPPSSTCPARQPGAAAYPLSIQPGTGSRALIERVGVAAGAANILLNIPDYHVISTT